MNRNKVIRLRQSELNRIVTESVKRILNERESVYFVPAEVEDEINSILGRFNTSIRDFDYGGLSFVTNDRERGFILGEDDERELYKGGSLHKLAKFRVEDYFGDSEIAKYMELHGEEMPTSRFEDYGEVGSEDISKFIEVFGRHEGIDRILCVNLDKPIELSNGKYLYF